MSIHVLERKQIIPCSLEEAWFFFSDPRNLKKITPESMGFDIVGNPPNHTYAGQMIRYKVSPFLNLPFTWLTEITQVNSPYFFIDEQRIGPYRLWHHQHHFRELPEGVEMTDTVHYILPLGWFGDLVHPLIKKKLYAIFDYRFQAIQKQFPPRKVMV